MNLQKLNPWNWLKHEEGARPSEDQVPIRREEYLQQTPQSPTAQFRREVDRLFEDAFRSFGFPSLLGGAGLTQARDLPGRFLPQMDIASDDKEYTINLEAPGLSEDDLQIDLQDRCLIISGEKKDEKTEQDKRYYRIERSYGSFQRVLSLPEDANADGINASMRNGVLKVTIPRSPEKSSGAKTIPIGKG